MTLKSLADTAKGNKSIGETAKMIAGLAVNVGAELVIGAALAAFVDKKKGIKKIVGGLGVLILAMKFGEEAENYFYKLVDDTKDVIAKTKADVEEAVKEATEAPAVTE